MEAIRRSSGRESARLSQTVTNRDQVLIGNGESNLEKDIE